MDRVKWWMECAAKWESRGNAQLAAFCKKQAEYHASRARSSS